MGGSRYILIVLGMLMLGAVLLVSRRQPTEHVGEIVQPAQDDLRAGSNAPAKSKTVEPPILPPALSAAERLELFRLRGEVTQLRKAVAESSNQLAAKAEAPIKSESQREKIFEADLLIKNLKRAPSMEEEQIRQELVQKEQELRIWWDALLLFVRAHDGSPPKEIAEVQPYLPQNFTSTLDLSGFRIPTNQPFEVDSLTKAPKAIVYEDPAPPRLPDGRLCCTLLFKDGSIGLFQ
jgi:hypothetical protein